MEQHARTHARTHALCVPVTPCACTATASDGCAQINPMVLLYKHAWHQNSKNHTLQWGKPAHTAWQALPASTQASVMSVHSAQWQLRTPAHPTAHNTCGTCVAVHVPSMRTHPVVRAHPCTDDKTVVRAQLAGARRTSTTAGPCGLRCMCGEQARALVQGRHKAASWWQAQGLQLCMRGAVPGAATPPRECC
jgi:hypothetical protein